MVSWRDITRQLQRELPQATYMDARNLTLIETSMPWRGTQTVSQSWVEDLVATPDLLEQPPSQQGAGCGGAEQTAA